MELPRRPSGANAVDFVKLPGPIAYLGEFRLFVRGRPHHQTKLVDTQKGVPRRHLFLYGFEVHIFEVVSSFELYE